MNETPQAAWYPDPSGEPQRRWWDGAGWTAHTHPLPNASHSTPPRGEAYLAPQATPQAAPHVAQYAPQAAPQQAEPQLAAYPSTQQAPSQAHLQQPFAQQQPIADAPATPPKRRKTWLIVTAAAAAVALITTGAIALPRILGNQDQNYVASTEPVVANGLVYMPPVTLDVSKESSVTFDLNVDYVDLLNQLQSEGNSVSYSRGIFDIFADRDLTVPVPTLVMNLQEGKVTVEAQQAIDYATKATGIYAEDLEYETTYYDSNVPWSEYSEYWVKRSYDEDGNKLELPEVTQIIPKFEEDRPAPIDAAFVKGRTDGSLKVTWTAPENADKNTEYLVLKSSPWSFGTTEDENWRIEIIGKVTGDTSYDTSDFVEFTQEQNTGFNLYSGDSADEQQYGVEGLATASLNATNSMISVVASSAGQFSPLALVAPDSSVRALPFQIAEWELSATRDETQKWNVGDLSALETWLPVTTLDGATRSMQVQIDPESLDPDVAILNYGENGELVSPDGVGMRATILGTTLTERYASYVPAGVSKSEWMEQLKTHIAAFNARSIADQAKTGAVLLTVEDADRTIDVKKYREFKAATETPEVDFPVFGTHPMVKHIAANMYAGEPAIDLLKWRDEPGAPTPEAAYREAMTQNPLLNYGSLLKKFDGRKLYVDYIFDQADREAAMKLSLEKAREIAATVEGKSDEDKAIAINQWVIDNTEYDYDSLAELVGDEYFGSTDSPLGRIDPDSEYTAWSPIGVFRDGTAVCMGYAQAFTLIAREAGLESIIVTGDVTSGGAHAWNRVSIDGTWKSLDPTWNDSKNEQNRYLLINESDYVDNAARTTSPLDNWILDINKSQFDTP